jgi:hypothetical protein
MVVVLVVVLVKVGEILQFQQEETEKVIEAME